MKPILSAEARQALMQKAIEQMSKGEIVDVVDANYSAFSLCIGDFARKGMALRNTWRDGMNWSWEGPGRINLQGQILNPGQESLEIEMDWS